MKTHNNINNSLITLQSLFRRIIFLLVYLAVAYFSISALLAAPLSVTLKDSISGELIANKKITAYKKESDGSLKWAKSATTDSLGLAEFELDKLGEGVNYVLGVKAYNTIKSYSSEIGQSGQFQFLVGKLQVKVVDGSNSILANTKVTVIENIGDEKKWISSGYTDDDGIIRFDLEGVGEGRNYFLKAKSPLDNSTKISSNITENGQLTFTVGNRPLIVSLVNGINGEGIADTRVVVKEKLADGSYSWVQQQSTDNEGKITFDLDGLGSGRKYILYTRPYNSGNVYSGEITATGNYSFRVGTVPVSLIDKTSNQVLANIKLTAYEKSPEGRLLWKKSGTTDEQGIVHFDLPGLNEGIIYVVKGSNIFGQNKRYYSSWIKQEGAVLMKVSPDDIGKIDLTPPVLSISNPQENAEISHMGFVLKGLASDNQAIKKINIRIIDPLKGTSEGVAQYNKQYNNGYWQYQVLSDSLSPNQQVSIEVEAYDESENISSLTRRFNIIDDNQAPQLSISSHQDNQQVSNNGFIVSGQVSDNTGLQQLTITLSDQSGVQIDKQKIVVAASGRWSFVVKNNILNKAYTNNRLHLLFEAVDFAANKTNKTIQLDAVSVSKSGLHPLNRITFGATPELLQELQQTGFENYLQQQMSPNSIDDSELTQFFGDWLPESKTDLINYQLYYASYSKRQLLEVMTWFWENHFSTDIRKTRRVSYELNENTLFRENALGSFKQLLTISATSPAMMIYLDNYRSRRQEPNENYARELLELHTMGVDGGYTAQDITEIARIFTGWRVQEQQFYFDERYHDDGAAVVLGQEIPAGLGVESGLMVLDILASHPSTAKYICTKLSRVFINDEPGEAIISSCSNTFLQTQGNISEVLWTIFRSEEFNTTNAFHKKIKTPIEYIAGLIRQLKPVYSSRDTAKSINNLGMPLFQYPLPTGWSETGDDWSNSNQLLLRLRINQALAFNKANAYKTHLKDPVALFKNSGYETVDGIVGYLFQLTMANDYTELEWQTAYDILAGQDAAAFDIDAEDSDIKLRELIATVLSFPAYQLQ